MPHVHAEPVAARVPAEQWYRASPAHRQAFGPCGEDFEGLLVPVRGATD
jgi:hypothetical protein